MQRGLNSTNENLAVAHNALIATHEDLDAAENKLEITQKELSTAKDEMATMRLEFDATQRELYEYVQKDDFVRDDDFDDGQRNNFDTGQMRHGEDSESDDSLW
jgi:chromosome segregation ATPase